MLDALAVDMTPWGFQIKRAHLAVTAVGKIVFRDDARVAARQEGVGEELLALIEAMTPARFDFLYAIYEARASSIRAIADALGLHPTTVSEMAARLCEIGFVTCERSDTDRRRLVLHFTRIGWKAMSRALHVVLTQRRMFRLFAQFLTGGPNETRKQRFFRRVHFFEKMFSLATFFRQATVPPDRYWYVRHANLYLIRQNPFEV